MSTSVISPPPQSQKQTLLVPSRDWVVVEAGIVPSYRPSPSLALLLCAVAFWFGEPHGAGMRRSAAPETSGCVGILSVVAWEKRNQSPGRNGGHDEITCTLIWRREDDLTRRGCCVHLQRR